MHSAFRKYIHVWRYLAQKKSYDRLKVSGTPVSHLCIGFSFETIKNYCGPKMKMSQFHFWISSKVIRVDPKYLWGVFTDTISFYYLSDPLK